jgi:hypothetical protein
MAYGIVVMQRKSHTGKVLQENVLSHYRSTIYGWVWKPRNVY